MARRKIEGIANLRNWSAAALKALSLHAPNCGLPRRWGSDCDCGECVLVMTDIGVGDCFDRARKEMTSGRCERQADCGSRCYAVEGRAIP